MKTNRRGVAAQFVIDARRVASVSSKLLLLWLFALPLFAHAVVQSGPSASMFGVTSPTATVTLPNFEVYPGIARSPGRSHGSKGR